MRITDTWRGSAAQNAAAAGGASKATFGNSPHNCVDEIGHPASRAFDFAVIDDKGQYVKDGKDFRYGVAGRIAEAVGLYWAGRWTLEHDGVEPDFDHIQMVNWRAVPVLKVTPQPDQSFV